LSDFQDLCAMVSGLDPALYTQCDLAFDLLRTATTQPQQAKARQAVKDLARHPQTPAWLRKYLRKVRVATQQERRPRSGETMLEVVAYLAYKEFMWTFLHYETHGGKYSAARLAKAYPCLGLTAAAIDKGLACKNQAAVDTKKKFGVEVSSLRSLFSRSARH
jgi:hypothetical protein